MSEPLARVIAYHASLLEHLEIDCDFSPLATGVLAAHVEARNRCLHLIVFGPGLPVESAVGLNRLRRSLESYTDELLSCLPPVRNCGLFCFEPQQLIRTQAKLGLAARQPIWTALCAMALSTALWQAVRHELDWRSGSARLNYQLSQHVLRLSNPSSFDSFGIPHASSIGRLLQSSPEAAVSQNEIYALFSADPFAKASLPRFFRSANGPRRVDP